MSETLRACPFCKGEATVTKPTVSRTVGLYPIAKCSQCGAEVPGDDADSATVAWNTRATDPVIAAAKALAEGGKSGAWGGVDALIEISRREDRPICSAMLEELRSRRAALLQALKEAGQ